MEQNEYDKLFSDLKDKIHYDQHKKIQSLNYINSMISNSTSKRKRNIKPFMISISTIIVTTFLIIILFNDSPQNNTNASIYSNSKITQSILAPTDSFNGFKAKLPLQMNVLKIEDKTFEKLVSEVFADFEEIFEEPSSMPIFDLAIYTEDQEIYQFKVWDYENGLVFLDLETEKLYKADSLAAANLLSMMDQSTKQLPN